ncbi:hypothetical protein D3C87_1380630 [compost metagenome]
MHDALGDAPGEVVLEEIQALLEHVAVVLPADHAGHAGAQGLVHQQIMQADKYGAQHQRNHHHPGQFEGVILEQTDVRRALGQVDDAAQVAEQRHLDQSPNQADDQQGGEARPDLFEVISVERENPVRRRRRRCFTENIDQFFKAAIKHWLFARERALLLTF